MNNKYIAITITGVISLLVFSDFLSWRTGALPEDLVEKTNLSHGD